MDRTKGFGQYIGDKKFFRKLFAIALPIMLQNGIANMVSLLDNVMVGRLGTEQMSGVSIVNQLVFIFFLCMFGAVGGTGIFTAQFYGQRNDEGIRHTFRFKFILAIIIVAGFSAAFYFGKEQLISLYLHQGDMEGDLEATLAFGKEYMDVVLIGLLFAVLEQVYSSTLRECGQTFVPMVASISAVFINLFFNYVLIFGHFGAPELGVVGAAWATNISRILQLVIVLVWTHTHKKDYPFIVGVYKTLRIPADLAKRIFIMAAPLIVNETLWASGMAIQTQIMSSRGLPVVAALNINSTIYNVFNIAFIAMGDAVAIIVGQMLGANNFKEGRLTAYRIILFTTVMSMGIGAILFATAPLFPQLYNTTDEVRKMATSLIRVLGACMPIQGFLHTTYFTIRSGGKTLITFLFDSFFLWVVTVPIAALLTYKTGMGIIAIYLCIQLIDVIKSTIGWFIMRSGVWMQNIVDKDAN